MNPYALTLTALTVAVLAQSVATGIALEVALRKPYRRAWMALGIASGLLALYHGNTLELGLRTGLYDLPQALLAGMTALLLAAGLFGLRRDVRQP